MPVKATEQANTFCDIALQDWWMPWNARTAVPCMPLHDVSVHEVLVDSVDVEETEASKRFGF